MTFSTWRGRIWIQLLFVLMANLASSAAQENSPNPLSVDPILRHLPLEKERVRPEATPNLNISAQAGRQTVVLRPYARQANPTEQMIVLHIPSEFFRRTTQKPTEVYGLNLLIQYPTMARYIEQPNGCLGWCEGKVFLSLEAQDTKSTAAFVRVRSRREDMKRQSEMSDPLLSFTRVTPPSDYDEAYDVVYNKWEDGSRYRSLYWALDAEGAAREFVECRPKVPSPACEFILSLPGKPGLRITYTLSASYWSERNQVRNSIFAFVRGMLDQR